MFRDWVSGVLQSRRKNYILKHKQPLTKTDAFSLGVSKLIVSTVHRDADEDDSVSVQ